MNEFSAAVAQWWHKFGLPLACALLVVACGSSADDTAILDDTAIADDTAIVADDAEPSPVPTDRADPDAAADDDHDDDADHQHDDGEHDDDQPAESASASQGQVDLGLFFDGALVDEVTTEPCTLSDGAETMCYQLTVAGDPVTYDTGPFCPTTITDTAEAGGLWLDGNGAYDLDGDFIVNLDELYNDDNWKLYDEAGNVNVTETAEEFDLAARPNVDPSLQNHCVEGRLEWLPNGEPVSSTVLIPIEPVLADTASASRGNLGVTLDGVVIAAAAPVDAILGAYTIAAFDDCGGHYNPIDGYHLHGATGCSELAQVTDGETPMFAYAMDGFPVHSPLEDPSAFDLDECNGHETEAGYHYHANEAAENLVIECFVGQTVTTGDAAGGPGRGRGRDG